MNVQQIAQDVMFQLAGTVEQWGAKGVGLLLVVIAACLLLVGWVLTRSAD